ncbi:PREDICTED: uncharacterized protein LOC109239629 [Nicotiana attenuata]|uniref:uncharacterized protein LOC109239629 n=1 Tax=Nicotiana attenuata TaxID=49451 RepID=UPI000905AB15|nr:PREDICTED: uncharacterized protein LOC109239629 [Nicotiana attenuata]
MNKTIVEHTMSTLYPEGKKSFLKETGSFPACGASSRGNIWHRNWNSLNFRIVKVPEKQQMMHLGLYLERSSLVGLDVMVDRVTTSSLKKDEEITKLKQKHADKITSLKEEMKEIMREEMRWFFSQMVKNNPGLDFHDIQGCVGSNIHSPVDASSAQAMRGQNLPNSSGSTHASNLEKVIIFPNFKNYLNLNLQNHDFSGRCLMCFEYWTRLNKGLLDVLVVLLLRSRGPRVHFCWYLVFRFCEMNRRSGSAETGEAYRREAVLASTAVAASQTGGGHQTPVAHTPEQAAQGLQTPEASGVNRVRVKPDVFAKSKASLAYAIAEDSTHLQRSRSRRTKSSPSPDPLRDCENGFAIAKHNAPHDS